MLTVMKVGDNVDMKVSDNVDMKVRDNDNVWETADGKSSKVSKDIAVNVDSPLQQKNVDSSSPEYVPA